MLFDLGAWLRFLGTPGGHEDDEIWALYKPDGRLTKPMASSWSRRYDESSAEECVMHLLRLRRVTAMVVCCASACSGFAGVIVDGGKLVLFLTDTSQAVAAKAALASGVSGSSVQGAEVRQARWDFAQLVNWFNYLSQQSTLWSNSGLTTADKNEAINRIVYGTVDSTSRLRLIEQLHVLDLPCDLIRVEVTGRAVAL